MSRWVARSTRLLVKRIKMEPSPETTVRVLDTTAGRGFMSALAAWAACLGRCRAHCLVPPDDCPSTLSEHIHCRIELYLDQGGGASAAAPGPARAGLRPWAADPARRAGRSTHGMAPIEQIGSAIRVASGSRVRNDRAHGASPWWSGRSPIRDLFSSAPAHRVVPLARIESRVLPEAS